MSTQLDAFALAAEGKAKALAHHRPEALALVPLAIQLVHDRADHRIHQDHIRIAGYRAGIIPLTGKGRELSFLSSVPKLAGLIPVGRCRSDIPGCHGNWRVIYTLPEYL